MLTRMAAKRDYEDFVAWLRENGNLGEPVFSNTFDIEGRRCGIPECGADGNSSGINFETYKKGNVWLCKNHAPAVQHVVDKGNGERILRELQNIKIEAESEFRRFERSADSSVTRAGEVHRVLDELAKIRPLMKPSADYDSVKTQFPDSVTFKVCDAHPELRLKLENIAGHQQRVMFAIEIVAANYGRKYNTVEKDWKNHKPRKEKPQPATGRPPATRKAPK